MIVDLVNTSLEDMELNIARSKEKKDLLIMYLQNNGDKNHFWDHDKFFSVINEDIDD